LRRDQEAAAHYDVEVQTQQGDMRDLSCFEEGAFDVVYHAYSLGFVPDARAVFRQVARVTRTGGLYHFNCANPFFIGLSESVSGLPIAQKFRYERQPNSGMQRTRK
jgi:ubiquinone/menaquinone biosynthesis C-methylase UbiE